MVLLNIGEVLIRHRGATEYASAGVCLQLLCMTDKSNLRDNRTADNNNLIRVKGSGRGRIYVAIVGTIVRWRHHNTMIVLIRGWTPLGGRGGALLAPLIRAAGRSKQEGQPSGFAIEVDLYTRRLFMELPGD